VECPLPWERLLWRGRSIVPAHARYALTDFRLVWFEAGSAIDIALHDIRDVQRTRSLLDKLLGTSTLSVYGPHGGAPRIVLRHIRRGAQLAALIELLASDPRASLDASAVQAALRWEPRFTGRNPRRLLAAVAAVFAVVFGVAISLRGEVTPIAYPPDDAIYPNGEKRDREEIIAFMEAVVMPWARTTLGPLVGGAGEVSCGTCHGPDGERRDWRMPSVAALPEPHVKELGWEQYSATLDAQVRNAIYGYVAESENQGRAGYMRTVVMPGMARLLGRPAYDFTRPYEYNRSRFAFGCYHCHRVR
jgi:hypothetical protein